MRVPFGIRSPASVKFHASADLDDDGTISVEDLLILLTNFGTVCP